MNLLCEDLERHIAGFCDLNTLKCLSNVSKSWRSAVNEAQVFEHGPINGTTFSSYTHSQHGPVYMQFVTEIQLLLVWDQAVILEALKALDLNRGHRKRNVTLHINQEFINSCGPAVLELLYGFHWYAINSDALNLDYFHTENANVTIHTIIHSKHFQVIHELTIIYYGDNQDISRLGTERAFAMGSRALVCYGVLTDESMKTASLNVNLKRLCLINEGCCEWTNATNLQRAAPNLESFSILSSNIRDKDLDQFDWSLWPRLKSLNLEHNYTLRGSNIKWPSNLEELYVAYTEIRSPEKLPNCQSIKQLSCNLQLSNNWFQYIGSKQLSGLSVYMREFIQEEREYLFWKSINTLNNIRKITVHHMEYFCNTNNVRKACPNSLVLKRSPVNIRHV